MTSEQTATDLELSVGEEFELIADGRARPAELLAVFDDEGGLDRLLVTDIATAQEWLDKAGQLTRVDVRVEDDTALAALRAALPDGTQVLSAAGRTRATADMSQAFMTNLTAMSLLALLVGLFCAHWRVTRPGSHAPPVAHDDPRRGRPRRSCRCRSRRRFRHRTRRATHRPRVTHNQ
jgi:putative ABC transport system permease protein